MADENIEAAQQKLYDAILVHALDLERTNRGLVFDMKDHVTQSAVALGTKLSERLEGLTDGELQRLARYRVGSSTKGLPSRVVGVINVIDAWSEAFDASTLALWEAEAPEFMQTEMDFARDSLDAVMVGEVGAVGVSAAAAYKEAMASPMLGSFFEEDLANATAYSKTIVYNTIREGITNGETTPAIVKSIVGTKSLQYKDGTINTTRNSVTSLVRTARTHMSTTAYDITYRALGVEKVIFIATMDGRTTFQCSSLDQNVYSTEGNYPRPPLHRGCRSTIAPYLGGDVDGVRPYVKAFKPLQQIKKKDRPGGMVGNVKADTSMVEFLKRPSNSAFAREYFGETRYKLFKSGKITLKQMIRADGSRMSIDELRTKYPKDFKAIFGE